MGGGKSSYSFQLEQYYHFLEPDDIRRTPRIGRAYKLEPGELRKEKEEIIASMPGHDEWMEWVAGGMDGEPPNSQGAATLLDFKPEDIK